MLEACDLVCLGFGYNIYTAYCLKFKSLIKITKKNRFLKNFDLGLYSNKFEAMVLSICPVV